MRRFTKQPAIQRRFTVLDNGAGSRVFVKTYVDGAAHEFARGRRLYELATRSGFFRAPRPLVHVESERVDIWEYIPGLVGLRDALYYSVRRGLAERTTRLALARDCGRSLAAIHREFLPSSDLVEIQPIPKLTTGSPRLDQKVREDLATVAKVAPHGDFACTNVFVTQELSAPRELVIVDPAPNPYLFSGFSERAVCPAYCECALWFYSLSFNRATHATLRDELDVYLDEFLQGYGSVSGEVLHRATVLACAALISRQYQVYSNSAGRRMNLASFLDTRFRLRQASRMLRIAETLLA